MSMSGWSRFQIIVRSAGGLAVFGWVSIAVAQTPLDDIATTVRDQSHDCSEPKSAEKDAYLSKPDEAVWEIDGKEGRYRVTYPGDEPSRVERL